MDSTKEMITDNWLDVTVVEDDVAWCSVKERNLGVLRHTCQKWNGLGVHRGT